MTLKWASTFVLSCLNFNIHILGPRVDELKTTAVELQDLVQSKIGTTKFSLVYNQIRQGALGIRRERKVARALQVTTNPEAAAKRKMQRNVIKKDSRKRKDRGFSYVLFPSFFLLVEYFT